LENYQFFRNRDFLVGKVSSGWSKHGVYAEGSESIL